MSFSFLREEFKTERKKQLKKLFTADEITAITCALSTLNRSLAKNKNAEYWTETTRELMQAFEG